MRLSSGPSPKVPRVLKKSMGAGSPPSGDPFLGGSGGVYLGEGVGGDDPFAADYSNNDSGVFFGAEDDDGASPPLPEPVTPRLAQPSSDFSSLLQGSDGAEKGESASIAVPVSADDYTLSFFNPLLSSEQRHLDQALTAILNALRKSIATPPHSLIRSHIASLVRFASESPNETIRTRAGDFVEEVRPVRPHLLPPHLTSPHL